MLNIDDILSDDKIKQREVKKIGRPIKAHKSERKVSTYLNEAEFASLEARAEAAGVCLSVYLKQLIKKDWK